MLYELINSVQSNDKNAMTELIERFQPLLRKYAAKLNYEDAYEDLTLYYIGLIKSLNLKKLICTKDEIIVSYINVSIQNFYKKTITKIIKSKKEIALSDLTNEQMYYVNVKTAIEDETDLFMELGLRKVLNDNECQIIYLIYVEGYTTSEIARLSNKSRQAVNQLKNRALKKIKKSLNLFTIF
ncbi:MAG: sigma-70 family RNA polymerase sigma factor [Lachnospiraceae bacterium]|nr:sigma-70 family RNA polymerase sigma factor [Lachnospiraceae bacterium]MDE6186171.1 sigma-70 family RNA polymerase sigma factor [Lachnospiraceae bacterium]MDE7286217.1 sigma-70 family RNA polymerase sigma factor [Lachnospiraceae bacterium]